MRLPVILTVLFFLFLPFQTIAGSDVRVNGRTFTPDMGRQMGQAYGFVTTIHGIILYTTDNCSRWVPSYREQFQISKDKWVERNAYYVQLSAKIYLDLLTVVSKSSGKSQEEVNRVYSPMVTRAVSQFKSTLGAKDIQTRNKFCVNFITRLNAGAMDVTANGAVAAFMKTYKSL